MFKTFSRVSASVVLLVATALLVAAAWILPDVFFSFYPALSKKMLGFLAGISSMIPLAVWELALVAAVLWFIITLIRAIVRGRIVRWLSGLLLSASIVVFAFIGLWGLNHFAPPMAERLHLAVPEQSTQQLQLATEYYLAEANRLSTQVPRDKDGIFAPGAFSELAEQASACYEKLAEKNSLFDGSTVKVKPLLSSPLLAKMGIDGIFIPFTAESCVSNATYATALPFTMCHEIGHRMSFAAEDEASFAAFLACDASASPVFRYSGYYEAFAYCYTALCKQDAAAAAKVWQQAAAPVQADYRGASSYYAELPDETASKLTSAVNDAYLKAFSESSGTQSYSEVTELLVAWYLSR